MRRAARLGQCERKGTADYDPRMDADTALMHAWDIGMDDAGWTEDVMDKAERFLPTLLAAGYAAVDDEAHTWWFTDK